MPATFCSLRLSSSLDSLRARPALELGPCERAVFCLQDVTPGTCSGIFDTNVRRYTAECWVTPWVDRLGQSARSREVVGKRFVTPNRLRPAKSGRVARSFVDALYILQSVRPGMRPAFWQESFLANAPFAVSTAILQAGAPCRNAAAGVSVGQKPSHLLAAVGQVAGGGGATPRLAGQDTKTQKNLCNLRLPTGRPRGGPSASRARIGCDDIGTLRRSIAVACDELGGKVSETLKTNPVWRLWSPATQPEGACANAGKRARWSFNQSGGPIPEAVVYSGHRRPAVQVETAKLVCSRPRKERTVGRMHGRESVAVTILTTRRQRGEHARKRETVRPDYVVAMCYGGKGNAGIRRPGRFRFRPVVWSFFLSVRRPGSGALIGRAASAAGGCGFDSRPEQLRPAARSFSKENGHAFS